MRWFGRLLRHIRQPSLGLGRKGASASGRIGQSGRDRRTHRSRSLRPPKRPRPGNGAGFSVQGGQFQGKGRVARRIGPGKPLRRQHPPRALQHRDQVPGSRHQAPPERAARLRHRLRPADDETRVLLHGQPRKRPGEPRRPSGLGNQPHLLHHRQRVGHQLPLRPHHQDRHHERTIRSSFAGHGLQCRRLPGGNAPAGTGPGSVGPDPAGGLGSTERRGEGGPLPGVALAELATDRRLQPGPPPECAAATGRCPDSAQAPPSPVPG